MKELTKLFIDKYKYYSNIVDIFDDNINKIVNYLKNNKNIISINIPNTLHYCLKKKLFKYSLYPLFFGRSIFFFSLDKVREKKKRPIPFTTLYRRYRL